MMERRSLFRLGFKKLMGAVADQAVAVPPRPAQSWVRPPYSQAETAFLLACDRCDACVRACPHEVLFALPRSAGIVAEGTPAMALNRRACRMCDGWPCAAACSRGALVLPAVPTDESEADQPAAPPAPPKLARAIIDRGSCLPYSGPECGACADSCPLPGALAWDRTRPVIAGPCTGCGLCRQACITDPPSIMLAPLVSPETPS
jgi:ferredoxin-type protein NapG